MFKQATLIVVEGAGDGGRVEKINIAHAGLPQAN